MTIKQELILEKRLALIEKILVITASNVETLLKAVFIGKMPYEELIPILSSQSEALDQLIKFEKEL